MDSAMKDKRKEKLQGSPESKEKTEATDLVCSDDSTTKPARKLTIGGLPAKFILNIRLASGGHEEVAALSGKAAIVHVFEHHSRTDLTLLRWKYRAEGWPIPEKISGRIFKKGSDRTVLLEDNVPEPGKPRALLLGKQKDIKIVADFLKLARDVDYPIVLAPQVVLYDRGPSKADGPTWWDNLARPGGKPKLWAKWWSMLRSGGRALISAADLINLQEFLSQPRVAGLGDNAAARMLLDTLRMQFREEKRVVVGPNVPQRERMKRIVKQHKSLIEAVAEEADRSGSTRWEVWNEVDLHLDGIMADYNVNYIRMWDKVLRWVWRRFFGELIVDKVGLERSRRAVRKGPVIYVPCHKSHTDYLILSYVLFNNDITPPHIAAGNNLSFWPLGHIFRKSGAFFMKRSFQKAGIYGQVFESYVRTLAREGFNIEFFIEGGRSRTGKMFLPKMGVLGMFLRAFEDAELPDLSFVPISITYARVPEEGEFLRDTQGSKGEKFKILKSIRELLKQNFGSLHMNFAPPISMKEYLASRNADPSTMDPESIKSLYRDFAFRVIHAINDVSVVTPTAVMAATLLSRSAPGVEEEGVMKEASIILDYLKSAGARLTPTLNNPQAAFAEALRLFRASRDIKEVPLPGGDKEDTILNVDPDRRPNLDFYKNGILHELYKPAMVASSLLAAQNEKMLLHYIEADCAMMMRIFKYEFVYDADWADNTNVKRVLEIFKSWDMVEMEIEGGDEDSESWTITKKGRQVLPLFAGLLENFVEAYLFTLEEVYDTYGMTEFDRDECAKKLMKTSVKAYHLGKIKRREAISKVTFQNAMAMAAQLGLIEQVGPPEEGEKPKWRISQQSEYLLDEYAEKLRRMSKVTQI